MNSTHPNESSLGKKRTRLKMLVECGKSPPPNSLRVLLNQDSYIQQEFDSDLRDYDSEEPT